MTRSFAWRGSTWQRGATIKLSDNEAATPFVEAHVKLAEREAEHSSAIKSGYLGNGEEKEKPEPPAKTIADAEGAQQGEAQGEAQGQAPASGQPGGGTGGAGGGGKPLSAAAQRISRCARCGNVAEGGDLCPVCADERRERSRVCVVEHVPDLMAIERTGTFRGAYHVLHGRLSPIRGIGPENLNFAPLGERLAAGEISELILALSNDIEGEATCHYIRETLLSAFPQVKVSRIGFGLPSGATLNFADSATLKNALDSRRNF